MHLKRQRAPKSWPIARKETKFIVKPRFGTEKGLPILIVLRDLLKVSQNKKEVKKAINEKQILLNEKVVKDEKHPAMLFDTINILPLNKSYRVYISKNRKYDVLELKKGESKNKISKVINKKMLKGKKVQLNLIDGNNFISDVKCKPNDSVLINFEKKKIEKCLPLKEKAKVVIFEGKHSGKEGTIEKIDEKNKIVGVKVGKENINVLIKQIMVIE